METCEFAGQWAESDLLAYAVHAEAPHVRWGGGLMVCAGSGLREWLAADLASVAGGALVGDLVRVCAERARAARVSGLGVVLFSAMGPASVMNEFLHVERTSQGWGRDSGLLDFGDVVQRFLHARWDAAGKKFVLVHGSVDECRSSRNMTILQDA